MLRKIKPHGTEQVSFVHEGFVHTVDVPSWKPTVQGLSIRAIRKSLDLGLRESARMMGLTGSELSAVERGEATWTEKDEFAAALAALTEVVLCER